AGLPAAGHGAERHFLAVADPADVRSEHAARGQPPDRDDALHRLLPGLFVAGAHRLGARPGRSLSLAVPGAGGHVVHHDFASLETGAAAAGGCGRALSSGSPAARSCGLDHLWPRATMTVSLQA